MRHITTTIVLAIVLARATALAGPGIGITIDTNSLTGNGASTDALGLRRNCAANQVLQWSGSAWACADNGNPGIGLPDYVVVWSGTHTQTFRNTKDTGTTFSTGSGTGLVSINQATGLTTIQGVTTAACAGGSCDRLYLKSGGAGQPGSAIRWIDSTGATRWSMGNDTLSTNAQSFYLFNNVNSTYVLNSDYTTGGYLRFGSTDGRITYDNTTQDLTFRTNGSDRCVINASGLSCGGSAITGDITSVTAGAGLTGGGTTGAVTLDITASSDFSVAADLLDLSTAVTAPGSLTVATTLGVTGDVTTDGLVTIRKTTPLPDPQPELDWAGYNGKWAAGIDTSSTPNSRDWYLSVSGTYSFLDGATTNGSATVTSASQGGFHSLMIGSTISGTGIPGGTTVIAVASPTSLTMSANATATGSGLRLTITQASRWEDVLYVKNRGALRPTFGVGQTPPDGSYKMQVLAPTDEDMGGTQTVSRNGNALYALENGTGVIVNNLAAVYGASTNAYNTTAGALTSYALRGVAASTRSSGANALTNIGLLGEASGGQNNYALYTTLGDVVLNATSGTLVVGRTSSFSDDATFESGTCVINSAGITCGGTLLTPGADITAVTAGNGLTGGGTTGAVTLDITASSDFAVGADLLDLSTAVTAPGTLDVAGNFTAGDSASADAHTFNGRLTLTASAAADAVVATYSGTGQTAARVAVNGVNAGTYDTTAGGIFNYGVVGNSTATRSAGANTLFNIGLYGNATGGQDNLALFTNVGRVEFGGVVQADTTMTVVGLLTATAGGTTGNNWTTTGTGDLVSGDDLTVADDATISDVLVVNGNTTIGDASGDTLTVNASSSFSSAATAAFGNGLSTSKHIVYKPQTLTISCGAGATAIAGSGDERGGINFSTATTTCQITFVNAYTTNAPFCVANLNTASVVGVSAVSTSSVTFTFSSKTTGDKLYYHCDNGV